MQFLFLEEGSVRASHLVLSLTVEPTKPRLCHDARFLNLWMGDMPFSLDNVDDLPRYVTKDSYQTVLDDKSGYDHLLLSEESRTFFEIQWGGWYFVYNWVKNFSQHRPLGRLLQIHWSSVSPLY